MGQKDHINKGLIEQKYKKIENTFQQLRLNYSNVSSINMYLHVTLLL